MTTTSRFPLGQAALAATTLTDIYTCPSSTETTVSTVNFCNRSAMPTTFRLALAPGGEADDDKHYLAYDADLLENETWAFTEGITMQAGDVLRAEALNATVSVNVFGEEKS